jgi:hypothetical protein
LKLIFLHIVLCIILLVAGSSYVQAGNAVVQTTLTDPLTLKNPFLFRMKDNRRLIAACLAFPLPTGFLGAHRIFLGTGPYIPVVYIATLGGCLGAFPLADFLAIVFTKDLNRYINNPKIFMWLK